MSNFMVFIRAMGTKGNWKHSGRTNKDVTNSQRVWLALCFIISGTVTLLTLGRITCWADIGMGLKFYISK